VSSEATKLIISPSWEEQRFGRARYEALAQDLRDLGFDVELEDPPDHSADALDLVDLALYLGNLIATGLAGALTNLLVARLSEKRRDGGGDDDDPTPSRFVVIYGPDDEILAELEIPERQGHLLQ
jgi:hypothetical protein